MALGLMNTPRVYHTSYGNFVSNLHQIVLTEGPTSKGYGQVCYWHIANGYNNLELKGQMIIFNTHAQLTFLKTAFGTISHKIQIKVTCISFVGENAHKDLDRGNPRKINTWLNGSSFYMKKCGAKIQISFDNKPLSHFEFWYGNGQRHS